jgi:hypothetical protein
MFLGVFSSFFSFFVPWGHAYACFWGFLPFFASPGHVDVCFWDELFILFIFFSFLAWYTVFLVLFLFIFFLCMSGTCVCVFWWFIYIIFILAPQDTRYMHVCRGFFFFFIFCSSLHPSNPFRPANTHYKPPDTCFKPLAVCFSHLQSQPTHFNHLRPPATHSLASQGLKRTYDCSYVRFFFCLFFLGSETRV